MMSSSSRSRRSALTALAAVLLSGLALTACTPEGPSSGEDTSSSTTKSTSMESPTPSPGTTTTVQVGKDGRTIDPAAKAESCALLEETDIRTELGSWADGLQAGQGEVATDRDGTAVDSCIYPLGAGAGVDHSAVIEQREYKSPEELAASAPFSLLMKAEAVPGLRGDAQYGVNTLTGSTEYVVVSVLDKTSFKLLVSVPSGTTAPEGMNAKEMLVALAKKAGF